MKCPRCNEELIYEDELDNGYVGEDTYCVTWLMACPKCDYERKLCEIYKVTEREWSTDEECNS